MSAFLELWIYPEPALANFAFFWKDECPGSVDDDLQRTRLSRCFA
jgi:hypothetical protein